MNELGSGISEIAEPNPPEQSLLLETSEEALKQPFQRSVQMQSIVNENF